MLLSKCEKCEKRGDRRRIKVRSADYESEDREDCRRRIGRIAGLLYVRNARVARNAELRIAELRIARIAE
jgi:hypothetical protein